MTNCRGLVLFRISGLNESSWSGCVGDFRVFKILGQTGCEISALSQTKTKTFSISLASSMLKVCCCLENRSKTATTGFKSSYLYKIKQRTSTLFYQKWNSSRKLIQIPFLHVLFCNLQSSIVVQKQSSESQCSTWRHVSHSASFDSLHPSCWSTCCKLAIATVSSLHKCSTPNRKWLFTSVNFSWPHFRCSLCFRFPAANEKC